jgi:malate/lactate dehydrogenase
MIPQKHQQVKLFMKNSQIILEGTVDSWTSEIVLIGSDGDFLIVHNPADILITKIMTKPFKKPNEIKQEIKSTLDSALNTQDQELKSTKLSQLRQLVKEQELNIISEKRKEHFINDNKLKYSNQINILRK